MNETKAVPEAAPPPPYFRDSVAKEVLRYGMLAVIFIASMAILSSVLSAEKTAAITQHVFTAVITLVSSWGGAVIAFYFGRENFEAANRAIGNLSKPAWQTQALRTVMLAMDKAKKYELQGAPAEITIASLKQAFETNAPYERLPLVNAEGVVTHVLHLSTLNKFLAGKPALPEAAEGDAPVPEDTFAKLLADTALARLLLNGFYTLSPDDTLERAKQLMDAIHECQDIIITADGKREGRAIGWVTNNAVLEQSKA
ncbi:MAG: hypothetical protein V4709_10940 [Pseudomonadota bacterium]